MARSLDDPAICFLPEFMQYFGNDLFIDRQKIRCDWSDTKSTDDRTNADKSAEQIADSHKTDIDGDSCDAKFAVQLVTYDDCNEIVWPGSGIRLDYYCHTKYRNHYF